MGKSQQNLSGVDVVVLCGGLGMRLRSVVRNRPKPMADVGGRPFLALLLDHLVRSGFTRFILCCGYRSAAIKSFFRTFPHKCTVKFSLESKPLGTGGALRHAARLMQSSNVIVMNGDSFCPVDYDELIRFHRRKRSFVTVAVCRAPGGGDLDNVMTDTNSRITAFAEKDAKVGSKWVNSGIYVFRKGVVRGISARKPLSLECDVFPALAGHRLFAYKSNGVLLDIGTPERYKTAQVKLPAQMKGLLSGTAP